MTTATARSTRRVADAPRKITSPTVSLIEGVWGQAIRRRHPELPPVAIVVSSGTTRPERGVALHAGHFAPSRWEEADAAAHHEIFVAGEIVNQPEEVLATLLHEAAHALAHIRGVKDTSRGGRYHNDLYRKLAAEVGLDAAQVGTIGYSDTSLTDDTRTLYAVSLERLAGITVARKAESRKQATGRKSNNNGVSASCPTCGRKVRLSRASHDSGPIVCWPCLEEATGWELDLDGFAFVADQDAEAGE